MSVSSLLMTDFSHKDRHDQRSHQYISAITISLGTKYSPPGKIDTFSVPSKSRKCVNLSGEKIQL